MRNLDSAKRRMIRDAIQTNVENPTSKVRRKRLRGHVLRWASLMTVPAVLVVLSFAIARSRALSSIASNANTATAKHYLEHTPEPAAPLTPPADLSLSVLPLTVKRIVIDAGHGGNQPGTMSSTGLVEKDVTLDIALRLRQLLKQSPYE